MLVEQMALQMVEFHPANWALFKTTFAFIDLENALHNNFAFVLADSPHTRMSFLKLIFLSAFRQIFEVHLAVFLKCQTLLFINCIRNQRHLERQFKLFFVFAGSDMVSVPDDSFLNISLFIKVLRFF